MAPAPPAPSSRCASVRARSHRWRLIDARMYHVQQACEGRLHNHVSRAERTMGLHCAGGSARGRRWCGVRCCWPASTRTTAGHDDRALRSTASARGRHTSPSASDEPCDWSDPALACLTIDSGRLMAAASGVRTRAAAWVSSDGSMWCTMPDTRGAGGRACCACCAWAAALGGVAGRWC
jgi:hypothetical protein